MGDGIISAGTMIGGGEKRCGARPGVRIGGPTSTNVAGSETGVSAYGSSLFGVNDNDLTPTI
jgi:hypothetical protein